MSKTDVLISLLLLDAALVVSFFVGRATVRPQWKETTQVDTLIVRDTVVENKTIYSELVRTVVDTFIVHQVDTVEKLVKVALPVDYKVESFADAKVWHHGFHSVVDSVAVYPRTVYITRKETITEKSPRWSLGAAAGPSVLVTPGGNVHAGVGISVGIGYRF